MSCAPDAVQAKGDSPNRLSLRSFVSFWDNELERQPVHAVTTFQSLHCLEAVPAQPEWLLRLKRSGHMMTSTECYSTAVLCSSRACAAGIRHTSVARRNVCICNSNFSRLYQGDLGFTRLSSCWNLQDELQTNPFLRPEEPALQAYTGKKDPVEVLGALRKKKDKF